MAETVKDPVCDIRHQNGLHRELGLSARLIWASAKDGHQAAVPGIVFLSGGQDPELATARLNVMNAAGPQSWALSFSYARAIQDPVLAAWRGGPANVPAAQTAFAERARRNGLARMGRYEPEAIR